jgi:hypothetical protein
MDLRHCLLDSEPSIIDPIEMEGRDSSPIILNACKIEASRVGRVDLLIRVLEPVK